MTTRAFTILEILCVSAILLVLAGLLFPVFTEARSSAQRQASLSNLRQSHLAIKMYQQDHDGDGRYGTLSQMGLPDLLQGMWYGSLNIDEELWKSPCGPHPSEVQSLLQYRYWPYDGDLFTERSLLFQENLVIVSDAHCSPHDTHLRNRYQSRRGLGVLLSGQLVNHFKKGDMDSPFWWSEPSP